MRHLERDARLDQSMVEAERMILDFLRRALASVKCGGLLAVDQGHAGKRLLISKVALRSVMPVVNLLHHLQPAVVVKSSRKLCEPRAQVVGDAVRYPDSDLRIALDGVLPSIRLFDSNAEDSDDG